MRRQPYRTTSRFLGCLAVIPVCLFLMSFVFWYKPGTDLRAVEPNRCKLCDFVPFGTVNSTERDAIFTAIVGYSHTFDLLVRSLRTTGCKASVVVFTNPETLIPQYLQECNVKVVHVEPYGKRAAASPFKIRWEWYYIHLREHLHEYDRIFHTDAFDAFFFSDPFSVVTEPNTLYFQMEDKPIRSCAYNKKWLLSCHYDCNRWRLLNQTIACSGSLLGSASQFLSFVEAMVTHTEWPSCWGRGFDQGDFNYILYTEYLPKHTPVLMNCNSGFLTIQYCSERGVSFDDEGYLLTPNREKRVTYVHQYNRQSELKSRLSSICS